MYRILLPILSLLVAAVLVVYFIDFGVDMRQYAALVIVIAAIPIAFLKPTWGLLALLFIRNIIDIFDQSQVVAIGSIELNIASLLGIALIPWALLTILRKLKQRNAAGIIDLLRIPLVPFWTLFIGISVLSAVFVSESVSVSLEMIIKLVDFMLLYCVGYLYSQDIGIARMLHWMCYVLVVPAVLGIVQLFTHSGFKTVGVDNRIIGTFAHPNAFAFALLIAFSSALILSIVTPSKKIKFRWFLIAGLFFILLIGTFTRSAWIGAFLVGIVLTVIYSRKLLFPAIGLVVLLFVSFPLISDTVFTAYNIDLNQTALVQRVQPTDEENSSVAWRFRVWAETLPAVWKSPLLGHGPGSFPYVRQDYVSYETDLISLEAHNDYLRLAIEVGILGLVSYVLLYAVTIKKVFSGINTNNKKIAIGIGSLLLAILILSFSDNVLRNAPVQWMLWSLTGVVLATFNNYEIPHLSKN